MRTNRRIALCPTTTLPHWLQAFLTALQPGGKGAIPGFPQTSSITTTSALARIAAQVRVRKLRHLRSCGTCWVHGIQSPGDAFAMELWKLCSGMRLSARASFSLCWQPSKHQPRSAPLPRCLQVMWTGGVQHHAMNGMKVLNYDFVYPIAPGKIFAKPLKKKGVLTEKTLLEQYIMPDDVTTPSETTIRGFDFILITQARTAAFALPLPSAPARQCHLCPPLPMHEVLHSANAHHLAHC